jgi:predicted nuclease with TOPRIM domain
VAQIGLEMTSEEEKTIRLLETRIRQLILKFMQLKEDNEELLNELVKKDSELQEVKQQNKQLEANYANLKLARMLEIGDQDVAEAKQRIARLVRDVDKCIALLKGMGLENPES